MFDREENIFRFWVKHPFAGKELVTQCGKKLRILSPGILNTDSGPDFFDARVELDGQIWIGNIEVHVRASDWLRHGHHNDKAYDNVILHVVAEHDANIVDARGNLIPVFLLPEEASGLHKVSELKTLRSMKSLESFGVARLERRAGDLGIELSHLNGDMEALFQRHLFRRFGMRTNSEPFQQLAHRIPGRIIRRERDNLNNLEALLFGQSGLLPTIPVDGYSADLLYRYTGLKTKYSLEPMAEQAWKFMRMRPSNFPTLRISQLAVLLHKTDKLYSKCAGESGAEELKFMFNIKASEYWNDHFRFGMHSPRHEKQLGDEAMQSILINAVALLRYFIGVRLNDQQLKDDAMRLLRELLPENNKLIRTSELEPVNALESQGVLELLRTKGGTNDKPPVCSEPHFPYFSRADYDRQQIHRQNCIVV